MIAAFAAQRKKLIRHFISVGAVSPERAVSADSLPRAHFHMLDRLRSEKVVCATARGTLYLDRARASELQATRKSLVLKIVAVVVLIVAAAAAASVLLWSGA